MGGQTGLIVEHLRNGVWLDAVVLAHDLLAWTQHLALADTSARTWAPNDCGSACSPSLAASCPSAQDRTPRQTRR
jgi:hypothetical protein